MRSVALCTVGWGHGDSSQHHTGDRTIREPTPTVQLSQVRMHTQRALLGDIHMYIPFPFSPISISLLFIFLPLPPASPSIHCSAFTNLLQLVSTLNKDIVAKLLQHSTPVSSSTNTSSTASASSTATTSRLEPVVIVIGT